MEKVIIFGIGDISQIACLYLSGSDKYNVVAYTMDESYIENPKGLNGFPVVAFENIETIYPPDDYKMFVPLSYIHVNQLREKNIMQQKIRDIHLYRI